MYKTKFWIIAFCLLLVVLNGCASSSTYLLQLNDESELKVTEINNPNPISPTNQYTVLWLCEEKCIPVSIDHVSSHGWLIGITKDAITSTGYALNGWFNRDSITVSPTHSQTQTQIQKGKP